MESREKYIEEEKKKFEELFNEYEVMVLIHLIGI